MKEAFVKLTKKPFVRHVAIVATGTAAAQAVTMVLSPLITRLYGPQAYGLMGVFAAIVGIIAPIAALTYPMAIVLPKRNSDARGVARLSVYITIGIAALVAILLLFFHQSIVRLFRLEAVASFLFFIPLVILFSGFLQIIEQWLIRTRQFTINAQATLGQAIIVQGSKVGIGFFYPTATVLIVLSALMNGLKSLLMVLFMRRSSRRQKIKKHADTKHVRVVAKKYHDFPIYRAPEVFLNAAAQSLPTLLLTSFFGPAASGFYTIGKNVLNLPVQLIGKSVGDVFYPRISEAANQGENLTQLLKKTTLALTLIGLVPFGVVIVFGPWLFAFVFGDEWVRSGEYARWIALWTFFGFVKRPSIRILTVLSAQAFLLVFTLLMLFMGVAALVTGYYVFANDIAAVALFGTSGALLNCSLILITFSISRTYDRKHTAIYKNNQN